jgi:hypothetical protein
MIEVDRCLFTYSPTEIVSEASDLGLKPGEWPDFIAIVDDMRQGYLIAKGDPEITACGDILFFRYYDKSGQLPVVKIFND